MRMRTVRMEFAALSKFYYDAARYDTYLDQLGVKYPQLVKP